MTGYVTPTTWEQCARHVEAGGVVEIEDAPGVWIDDRAAATTYRGRCGAPDDGWAPRRLLTEAVERCADIHGQDRWEDDCHGCGFRVGDHTTDGRCPPVPPWPGAVLSGLVDEDGVPTWLAQAGQVRGEQVRRRSDLVWVNNDQMVAHLDTVWVEVRAPRPVPVPETERVPWWEAVGRVVPDVGTIREVGMSDDQAWVRCGDYDPDGVDPDGTVEVLKDGES